MLAAVGAMSAITLLVSGSAWVLTSYVDSSLGRVNAGTSGTPSSGPVNILVAGVDTRGGLTHRQEIALHVGSAISANSDTLMLVHIPADHRSVEVVSLPRDSWVEIPGHGMNKINAAYGIGGASLMVSTVEQATGLTINDYIEVNFLGFVKVINALGGVRICVPFAVDDSYSGLHLSAGSHHVDGVTALKFARDRHSFAASDLARIQNQQQLMSSLFAEATQTGVLANPVRLQQVLSSVTAAVKVDKGFNLIRLADELRGLRSANITFTTVPIASASYITPTGQDAVLWDAHAAAALFSRLKKDTGAARPAGAGASHSKAAITRAQVSVDVYNGTTDQRPVDGDWDAAQQRRVQRAQGGPELDGAQRRQDADRVPVGSGGSGPPARQGRSLARRCESSPGIARIRLVLGAAAHTVTAGGSAGAQPDATPTGAPSQSRTAAQDACR